MFKKVICGFMACLFLASSMLLPLSDFSLLRDIPDMYRSYTHIAAPEELGILDFIGDYLLHGKEILGHNKKDKPQHGTNPGQFLHQANPISILVPRQAIFFPVIEDPIKEQTLKLHSFRPLNYNSKLLRPPLA